MGAAEGVGRRATTHAELEVWKRSFAASMRIFELSKAFPREEMYSLTDQIRRSSRSVTVNITEAWRKRRYEAAFISKLSDAEAEAAETQDWLRYAAACKYLDAGTGKELHDTYETILRTLVGMIDHAPSWTIPSRRTGKSPPASVAIPHPLTHSPRHRSHSRVSSVLRAAARYSYCSTELYA